MVVLLSADATPEQVNAVCAKVESLGFKSHTVAMSRHITVAINGKTSGLQREAFLAMPGVVEVSRVTVPYRLAGIEVQSEPTVLTFPGHAPTIGAGELAIIAGPCSIESREQAFAIAERVFRAGARFFRGGCFKPIASTKGFQGLGEEAMKILAEVRERFGLLTITEVIDDASIELAMRYVDILQVGSRNMQNFPLLKSVGRVRKPVMLKRGMSATMEEYLLAAEYILSEGNWQVMLCERGVRTFADHTQNTLDLSLIPAARQLTHLPLLVDPSQASCRRDQIVSLSRAAVAAGADGLMIEVHNDPASALSGGEHSLTPDHFDALMAEIRPLAALMKRSVPAPKSAETA
jgi:3-deoxy-7-phosphoheptulonate synthase